MEPGMSNGFGASYIRNTYERQDGREDPALERGVLWSYDQGLPGEEVRFGNWAFRVGTVGGSVVKVSAGPVGMFGRRDPYLP